MLDRYAFSKLKNNGHKAFIPFTVLGYPDTKECLDTIKLMIDAGATALELGIAFSDPLADGPIIQEATQKVIESGFSLSDAFALIQEIRAFNQEIPIGLLVYYNLILACGIDNFYKLAHDAGVDGILIPELPPEAADEVMPYATKYNIKQIFMVSPVTSKERLLKILHFAGGFIYVVSRLGITGIEEKPDEQLKNIISPIHETTSLPVYVGFGISSPEQARKILALGADGVITGSKIIELTSSTTSGSLKAYLKEMFETCSNASGKVLRT